MTERADVHRSQISTSDWEADPDVGGEAHMLYDLDDRTKAGLWRASPGARRRLVEVHIPALETLLILEGAVRVTIDRGAPHDLVAGDMLAIPAGALVGWDPSPDCLVFWTYS